MFRPFSLPYTNTKLAREYFSLIGVLSSFPAGLRYFQKHDMWSKISRLCKDDSKDYLSRRLLANLDYGMAYPVGLAAGLPPSSLACSGARTLLSHWMRNGSTALRKFALCHLRLLFRAHIKGFNNWGFELLVQQVLFFMCSSSLPFLNSFSPVSVSASQRAGARLLCPEHSGRGLHAR